MRRGEIYTVDLGPGVGREPTGTRPVVVVSNDTLNSLPWMIVIVPGIDATRSPGSWPEVLVTAAESGLPANVHFLPHMVRALDYTRFPAQPVGTVPADRMADIDAELLVVLELK